VAPRVCDIQPPRQGKGRTLADSKGVPRPGDVIADKYRVEREIGSGGMGTVYEVTHLVTHRRFAIKWLDPALATSPEATQRFVREAQIAGSFDHPNVVEVYDLGIIDGSYFMLMELLEGESLAARLANQGRLSVHETFDVMVPCLKAVAAAHVSGIVHRDLKPANIFLCQATSHAPFTVKVLDFGISKLVANSMAIDPMRTKTGAIMGTPHYMAPEQMRGQRIDHRVDIYALGVTLYEVMSGQRPFDANSYPELVLKIVGDPIVPLDRLVPDLPRGLSSVVSRAMSRDPADRYPSVHALLSALAPFRTAAGAQLASLPRATGRTEPVPPQRPQPRTPLFSESIAEGKTVSTNAVAAWPWWAGAAAALTLIAGGVVWERESAGQAGREDSMSAASAAQPDGQPGLNRERAAVLEGVATGAERSPESQSLIGAPVIDPATAAAADGIVVEPIVVPSEESPEVAAVTPILPPSPASPLVPASPPVATGQAPSQAASAAAAAMVAGGSPGIAAALPGTGPVVTRPAAPAVTGPVALPQPSAAHAGLPPVAAPNTGALAKAPPEPEHAPARVRDPDETPEQVLEDLRRLTPDDAQRPARARPRMDTSEF